MEGADVAYVAARVEWLAKAPGNSAGAAVTRIGGATVLRATGVRSSIFNRVLLANDELVPRLDEAIDALGGPAPLRVDVLPPLPSSRLMGALIRRGFACTGHFTALYGSAGATDAARRFDGKVRQMREGELDSWTDVYLRAFGIAGPDAEPMGSSLRALVGREASVMLVAELDGRMAAITALWIDGTTGYVALCATLPDVQGRGCQSALIRACADISAERGCDLLAAHAAVGSQSQRNFEHAGMRIAFHKGIWTRPSR